MTPQCTFIKSDGKRCRGRAMRGSEFCGPHHDRAAKHRRAAKRRASRAKQQVQPRLGSVALYRPDPAVREAALERIRLALEMEPELERELDEAFDRAVAKDV